jgi:hypothetical protein
MASLTEHLRRPDDHGRLAFRPDCPLCCEERLAGPLLPEAVVGRRTRAALAAGMLALSSATPTAALATEPDEEHEGATAPEQVVPDETLGDPGFDPGGETDLQFDVASGPAQAPPDPAAETGGGQAVPAADPADETDPVEQEPATDSEAPVADAGDGTGTASAPGQPASPSEEPLLAPPATERPPVPEPPAAAPPPSDAPVGETQPTAPAPTQTETSPAAREKKREAAHHKKRRARATTPSYASAPAPAPRPEPIYVSNDAPNQSTPEVAAPVVVNRGQAVPPGDGFHVVQQGESLWSIASDQLGEGASTARIARQVNRLWELNSGRIGTGDRDLLMVGTRIELR